jgi:hypothetical protein
MHTPFGSSERRLRDSHKPNRRPGEHTAVDPQEINHPAAR